MSIYKLENICHGDMVNCVYLIHKYICIKYEGSMTNQTGIRGKGRKMTTILKLWAMWTI